MEKIAHTVDSYKRLGQFLKDNETVILDLWEQQIIVHSDRDNLDLIRKNGYLMYSIITNSIINKLSEEDLQQLAYKVAHERVAANANIGEFVYNVNLGRSAIVKGAFQSGMTLEELQPWIEIINTQFDLFCSYAVSKYTELKDQNLQEKNLFISQTHKDRLAILGQMSSSFVHEFRNPLTSIMGFIKLLRDENPNLPYLDVVSIELDQLKFRITQFLHTSKLNIISDGKIEDIPIKSLLEEVLDFLYPSIADSNVEVESHLEEATTVFGDRNELKQVFLNLLMNAVDAVCEEQRDRKIILATEVEDDQINILISNNGATLKDGEEHLIFEPFYTTKKLGTGIGLYVCKNIIEKHNGTISCKSEDNITTFKMTFPIKE